jgi:putative membrane protein
MTSAVTASQERLRLMHNQTLRGVAMSALLLGLYSAIAAWLEHSGRLRDWLDVPTDLHAAFTLVLGWLLVFRTNTSYARWWEARTAWGSLINVSRNLALKFVDLVQLPAADADRVQRALIAVPWVLKDHLRDGASLDDEELPPGSQPPQHVPGYFISMLYQRVREWHRSRVIDGSQLIVIDDDLRRLMDIVGTCERIRNTRLARSYRTFARQCVFLYILTLPWGIVGEFGWWTVPLTVILCYFMLGLEVVAEHTEEPFGLDEDDLDLGGYCRTIESSVMEIFARRLAGPETPPGAGIPSGPREN